MAKGNGTKLIAQNKKAYHDYFIEDVYQAGISLVGTEVKSLRAGKCSLKESFIRIENGQAFIMNMHISPYEQGNIFNKDPPAHQTFAAAQKRNPQDRRTGAGCRIYGGTFEGLLRPQSGKSGYRAGKG